MKKMALSIGLAISLSLLPVGCVDTSTRPVIKIGLLAPFEGLYRRTGYEALAAMRLAIDEADGAYPGLEVLPLALNDSNRAEGAQWAAQKLLVDPTVVAVVGPLTPGSARGAADLLTDAPIAWLPPFAPAQLPSSSIFREEAADQWVIQFVAAVADAARSQGAERLALAGEGGGWLELSPAEWESLFPLPASALTSLEAVRSTDAVLWLGDVAQGAYYLAQLRQVQAEVPFWLGPAGGDPVFIEHAVAQGVEPGDGLYWATWLDVQYAEWHQRTDLSPSAYLTYRATQQAIAFAAETTSAQRSLAPPLNAPLRSEEIEQWNIYLFELSMDGASIPLALSQP